MKLFTQPGRPGFEGDNTGATAVDMEKSAPAIQKRLITRFGELVDVRNRGAVRIGRFAGSRSALENAPAVVRVWHAESCREMSSHEARAFAGQLLAAAALAESQNSH